MNNQQIFDVIIIGGSNAGLSAGMSLGRGLKNVLIIDSGKPCNKSTPHSHNFLTHDGHKPAEIIESARKELLTYPTVQFLDDLVTEATGSNNHFEVNTAGHQHFRTKKLLFATGVKDIMPDIEGFAQCWGKSVIHCPYCHGYEYRGKVTGILMNGDTAAEYATFIHNWTNHLTLYTNGKATLTAEQQQKLTSKDIRIVEKTIKSLEHENGYLTDIVFTDGTEQQLEALYAKPAFEQHCKIPQLLGCSLTEQGYIQIDELKKTSVPGIYAAGDNTTPFRSVANAVAAGSMAGAMLNHEIIKERG